MPATDAVLDAIVMVVASDGEVTEREMQLALTAAKDLPSLHGHPNLERSLGEAFERFVDQGSDARLAAMGKPVADVRLEILLAASVAATVDGPITEDETACVRRVADAIGATADELRTVLERDSFQR
ncbi:MAG TPA: TerB family tellurite resistance protein [Polyangiaceae bacterium]|jgi:tellurite resistance protein|nr:TerB family tellurite resistance protein [Polyangiaceae bacterium]